jgi:anti-sigma factor RsiW
VTPPVPDCGHTRDRLEDYRRRALSAEEAAEVETHLADCPACRVRVAQDDALATLIRALPATPAPPALRRRIEEAHRRPGPLAGWLGRPAAAAVVAAALVALGLSPWLQFHSGTAPDPVESLLTAGVSEHRRILLQIPGEGTSDPGPAFARIYALTAIELPPAFAGGPDLRFVAARPTLIADRKAAAAVLLFGSGSVTTYFAVPGKDLPMPTERRVQIEQYRPYLREIGGFHCVYWKQGDLAYLMVTDLDEADTRRLFLRMRKAL